jgi:hypothetical protein
MLSIVRWVMPTLHRTEAIYRSDATIYPKVNLTCGNKRLQQLIVTKWLLMEYKGSRIVGGERSIASPLRIDNLAGLLPSPCGHITESRSPLYKAINLDCSLFCLCTLPLNQAFAEGSLQSRAGLSERLVA